jgi:hypothetical protein
MIHVRILLSFGLIILFGASAEAFFIHQGIHGMKWGGSVSDYEQLTKVHQKGQAAFYVKTNMLYHTGNQRIARVSYGFYRKQLYAAFIKLRSADQFSHLAQKFSEKHGEPKITYEDVGRQIIYRWKVADVKIKLKMKNSIREYKLAFYYSPLADSLNQEQLEQIPAKAYGPDPSKEADSVKSVPLLDY